MAASDSTGPPSGSPKPARSDRAVAELLHDLRNQLTLLVGSAEKLADLVPAGEGGLAIGELRRYVQRASVLVWELLTATRPRSVHRHPVDLSQWVVSALETLSVLSGSRSHLRFDVAVASLPVAADPVELEGILVNLAVNAYEAMGAEGLLTIETAVADDPRYARLTVADTGPGMTPEVRARMFEPYFTTKDTNTGLGLSSVALTVSRLQGKISVESQPGRGTAVTVLLPLALHT